MFFVNLLLWSLIKYLWKKSYGRDIINFKNGGAYPQLKSREVKYNVFELKRWKFKAVVVGLSNLQFLIAGQTRIEKEQKNAFERERRCRRQHLRRHRRPRLRRRRPLLRASPPRCSPGPLLRPPQLISLVRWPQKQRRSLHPRFHSPLSSIDSTSICVIII